MQFTPSFLDEIRSRFRPSEVVRKKVLLKAHGHVHKGLCPFHKEKTPSFTVDDTRGTYHCFGCGAHGDIIKFVMETERMSFPESVKQLAGEAGLALPDPDPHYIEHEKKTKSLYEVMEQACKYFEEQLNTTGGSIAREYLKKRELTSASIKKFRVGYAPDSRFALKKFLEAQGVSLQEMLDVGLLTTNDKGDVYDKFRGRVMFPIFDIKNRVVAFGGRVLDDSLPKYLNSPETILFKKSDILYNENNARQLAIKTGKLVVAEGYMDVIAMDAAGIRTAVAPMGTAVTEKHLQLLWRMVKEPVMCLDGDTAGRRAMERAARLCLPLLEPGNTLKFAVLAEGMDPDDFIKRDGTEAMRKVLQQAKPLSEVLWEIESAQNPNTPEKLAALESRLNGLSNQIKNTIVSKYYNDFFRNKLWQLSKKKYSKSKSASTNITNIEVPSELNTNSIYGSEIMLLLLILQHPSLLKNETVRHDLGNENLEFSSDKLDKIRASILELCHWKHEINSEDLRDNLVNSGLRNDIEYLEGLKKDFFIDNNVDFNRILSSWQYYVSLHQLLCLKSECSLKEIEMTPESEKIVAEFRKQIAEIERKIRHMEMAFGDE
ncbi:MAG: dnaG [Rickettsiaceae bacterium]|jgi:DNA primase|nr:dnaG [Rickettsiaceae bacterium]